MNVANKNNSKRGSKKPNRADKVSTATQQAFKDASTADITRQVHKLSAEGIQVEAEIDELSSKLDTARRRKADIHAELTGLQAVVAKR